MRFARVGLGFGRRWLRLSDSLSFLVVEAEAEGGVAEGSGDADGNDLTFFLFLEKWFNHLQQECLRSFFAIRYFRIDLQLTAQINLLIEQVVGAVHAGIGAGNSER